jgi:tetratricopeptide (TPR) repeat protein
MSNAETNPRHDPVPNVPAPSATKRRDRTWRTAGVAISLFGIAGFVFYMNFPSGATHADTLARGPNADYQAAGEAASKNAIVSSRLEVLRIGGGNDARTVIALATPTGPSKFADIQRTDQGLIARELVRQALLIAARDELGLATRDEVLDDAVPARSATPGVTIASVFPTDGPSRMLVRQGEGEAAKVLLEHRMGPVPNEVGILAMILPVAESLSRTEFPEMLKGLGVSGKRNAVKPNTTLPQGVEERLQGLGFVEHFAAIRDLHEAIRADGESPERLGALSRAYAQLGVLTEFHWHPAHKVYKARALLYAQRILVRDPVSVLALRNRAFVRSVIGLHQEALDDLEAAAKQPGVGDQAPPAWLAPIEAYARLEVGRLRTITGPYAKLARLLGMLAVEYPLPTNHSLQAAKEVVSIDDECYRAHDAMCRVGGLSNLHMATLQGPDAFTRHLPENLKAVASLPAVVKQTIEKKFGELDVVDELDKAGIAAQDVGEPSWGALAHLIRETRFVQVTRRVIFMKMTWAVPVDEYWADVQPFVAKHRYLPFLEIYVQPPQEIREAFVKFANTVDLSDLENHEPELCSAIERHESARGEKHIGGYAFAHGDAVARDLGASVQTQDVNFKTAQAKVLLAVSPHSTLAQSILVYHRWDEVKDKADAWEQRAGDSPLLLDSLGSHFCQAKQYERGRLLLRRCLELSPQRSVFEEIAGSYKDQGDMEGWRKTLDEYLEKGEDLGLDHANIRVQIARYFMGQKRWKEAAPYAEAAASTWAGWAMECAVECYEAMGEWEKGAAWVQRLSERYSNNNWAWWYCYCKRTGHGDIASAREWTDAYLESARGRPDLANPTWTGYYYWLSGSPKRAQDVFDAQYKAAPSPSTGVQLVLAADEAGDTSRRDEVMKQLCTTMKDQAPKTLAIFQLMRDALAADKPLDLPAVDAILKTIPPEGLGNAEFCVGIFLMNHGRPDSGRDYLRKSASSPQTLDWSREIANSIVRANDPVKKP